MKQTILIFQFIVMSLVCDAQVDALDFPIGTCEEGIKNAVQDAKKGKYKLLGYGLPFYDDWDFEDFYIKYVKEKHGITIGNGGCVIYVEEECYSKKMEELISSKFGKDFFTKARSAAQKAYKISVNEKIDTGFVFSRVHKMPEFIGGQDSLAAYFCKGFSCDINDSNLVGGKLEAQVIIEKDGDIKEVKILKSLDKETDEEVVKVLKEMPNWKPGIYFDRPVRVAIIIPFIIYD